MTFVPQVRRQTLESLDFYQRYETLLRTEVEKKKAHLYKRQAKLANQVRWGSRLKRGVGLSGLVWPLLSPTFFFLNRNGHCNVFRMPVPCH